MESSLGALVGRLTEIYIQQKKLYEKLSEITSLETEAIRNHNMLQIIELLQMENDLMEQVHALDKEQKELRLLICRELPGQSLSMDQLVCTTEPKVSIALKSVLLDIKTMLADIEDRKGKNVTELSQTLRFLQPM
jgi:hypothetical protein